MDGVFLGEIAVHAYEGGLQHKMSVAQVRHHLVDAANRTLTEARVPPAGHKKKTSQNGYERTRHTSKALSGSYDTTTPDGAMLR